MFPAASWNRSKNSRSLGRKTCDKRAMWLSSLLGFFVLTPLAQRIADAFGDPVQAARQLSFLNRRYPEHGTCDAGRSIVRDQVGVRFGAERRHVRQVASRLLGGAPELLQPRHELLVRQPAGLREPAVAVGEHALHNALAH